MNMNPDRIMHIHLLFTHQMTVMVKQELILLIVDVYYCITSLKGSVGILFYRCCISQMAHCSIQIINLTTCYSVLCFKKLKNLWKRT